MGRAIVREPAVFLFDEPLSNLDAKLRVQMRLEIKALQRKLGVTALYVTHDQVEAMTLADRMIVMNAGVAEQIGAPLEVYANPATLFVAGFIGSPPTACLPMARASAWQSIRRVSWHLTPPAAARKSETVQCSSTASATAHCRLPLTTTHWSSRP
jgi:ABC-type sugar transport system ATPase subunit